MAVTSDKGRPYLRPPPLRPGDRVRVVAPSGPVPPERFAAGLERLRGWGLEPVFNDGEQGVFAREAYLAGSDSRRRAELAEALADESASAIWVARGGYGAARLLPSLSPTQLCARPRWLVGFSDVTALHVAWQHAGLQSLHAANVTGLDSWSEPALRGVYDRLFHHPDAPRRDREHEREHDHGGGMTLTGEEAVAAKRATATPVHGPLLGGNLTVLASLVGTGWLPSFRGAIVFLEDVSEAPYRLDRSLTQLKLAGCLSGAAGFVIGQLTDCVDREGCDHGRDALGAVCDVLAPLGVPVLSGVAVGHERSSLALPLGAPAVLDIAARELHC